MSTEILREYLFKLSYLVDKQSDQKAKESQKGQEKRAQSLAKAFAAVGVAAAAMAVRFGEQMEKLYYASQRSNASAANLQALEYAASRVGVEGGKLTAILEGLNTAFQVDPGKKGMVEAMGIDTAQDKAAVLVQIMEKLFAMDDVVGARMAESILGMGQADYLQIKRNRAEFYKYVKEKQDAQERAGVDMDKAAEAGHKYANALKTIGDRLGTIKDIIALNLLEPFEGSVNLIIDGLDWIIARMDRFVKAFSLVHEAMGRAAEGVFTLNPKEIKGAGKVLWDVLKGSFSTDDKPRPAKSAGAPPSTASDTGRGSSTPAAAAPAAAPAAAASQSVQELSAQFKNIPTQVLEFAKAAADKLQVPITHILAQLRAEVGPKFEKFIGQYNYGNIKAGKSWKGETQERTVHEFDKQGNKYYVKDKFRAYSNPSEAGLDYADLLARSYPKVIGSKYIEQFAAGLQSGIGGRMYATDPKYQEKLAATERAIQKQNAVTLQQTNTYNITSPNPQAAGQAVGAMQQRTNADAVRNLGGVIR